MKLGDLVRNKREREAWMFEGPERSSYAEIKLGMGEPCVVLSWRVVEDGMKMVELLTPRGTGWISERALESIS